MTLAVMAALAALTAASEPGFPMVSAIKSSPKENPKCHIALRRGCNPCIQQLGALMRGAGIFAAGELLISADRALVN